MNQRMAELPSAFRVNSQPSSSATGSSAIELAPMTANITYNPATSLVRTSVPIKIQYKMQDGTREVEERRGRGGYAPAQMSASQPTPLIVHKARTVTVR